MRGKEDRKEGETRKLFVGEIRMWKAGGGGRIRWEGGKGS